MAQEALAAMTGSRDNAGPGREFSAGGVVLRGKQLLLVRVRNLKGELRWTFPKGHLEAGETPREAALREVEEETGYRCRILRPAMASRYSFRRSERVVHKKVQWYWMEALARLGPHDASEILSVRWATLAGAAGLLSYPSDLELLRKAQSMSLRRAGIPE